MVDSSKSQAPWKAVFFPGLLDFGDRIQLQLGIHCVKGRTATLNFKQGVIQKGGWIAEAFSYEVLLFSKCSFRFLWCYALIPALVKAGRCPGCATGSRRNMGFPFCAVPISNGSGSAGLRLVSMGALSSWRNKWSGSAWVHCVAIRGWSLLVKQMDVCINRSDAYLDVVHYNDQFWNKFVSE